MSESRLNLEAEECQGIQVIHVNGPLDSVTFEQFKSFMEPRITQSRTKIVLDCEGLSYVNSRGLTLLVRYQRAAKQEFSFLGISGLIAFHGLDGEIFSICWFASFFVVLILVAEVIRNSGKYTFIDILESS